MKIQELTRVQFQGVLDDKNISAIVIRNEQAVIVTDELTTQGNALQIFDPDGDGFHAAASGPIRLDPPGVTPKEMDLEGIASGGDSIFIVGSHSAKRKKVDSTATVAKNREALTSAPKAEPARDVLLRLTLSTTGTAGAIDRTSLREFLDGTEPFRSFRGTASKENGPDIEGLAVFDDHLYVGFRGPVLRGNFTPILRCRFGDPIEDPKILFVNLGGRGVRDLAEVVEGILILAGPVGDGPGTYQIYRWNGKDDVPGDGSPAGPGLVLLGDIPVPDGAKAEGLAVTAESDQHWDVLVVFDGLADDGIRYRVQKP